MATGEVWRVNDTIKILKSGRTHAYTQVNVTPKNYEDAGDEKEYVVFLERYFPKNQKSVSAINAERYFQLE
jgi:hypothetical protein